MLFAYRRTFLSRRSQGARSIAQRIHHIRQADVTISMLTTPTSPSVCRRLLLSLAFAGLCITGLSLSTRAEEAPTSPAEQAESPPLDARDVVETALDEVNPSIA